MPKIFALRDRLLAVQESLTGNQEELEIFPEKRFNGNLRAPKYNGNIIESSTSDSSGETDTPTFAEDHQYGCKRLLEQYLGYQCANEDNENNTQPDNIHADTKPVSADGIEETIRVKCAIEIEKKEGPSFKNSEEVPIQFPKGKSAHIIYLSFICINEIKYIF